MFDTVLEKGRGLDGSLHSGCGGCSLLVVRNDADEGMHLGPMLSGATSTARESDPSGDEPISHATKPPKRDRQADPDPWRAISESSDAVDGSWYSAASDFTRAAKPETAKMIRSEKVRS